MKYTNRGLGTSPKGRVIFSQNYYSRTVSTRKKVSDKIDRTAKWATEQVTLGITGDLEEKTLKTEQEYNNLAQLNFAKPEQLPDYPALNNTDSFELEDTEVDKLLHQDPYLGEVISIKQEPGI